MQSVSRGRGRFRAASRAVMAGFAAETLPSENPVGIHASWRYRPAADIVEHLEEPLRLILAVGNRSAATPPARAAPDRRANAVMRSRGGQTARIAKLRQQRERIDEELASLERGGN